MKTYYVDLQAQPPSDGSRKRPFKLLRHAFLLARDGDRIMVRFGDYSRQPSFVCRHNVIVQTWRD